MNWVSAFELAAISSLLKRGGFMFVGIPAALFSRSVQLDSYSCGSRCVFMVLVHFRIAISHAEVKALLGTNPERGTAVVPMMRVLRKYGGLRVGYRPNLLWRELEQALRKGAIALISVDGDHFAICHGVGARVVHVADPSVLRCPGRRIAQAKFLQRFGRCGLLVSSSAAMKEANHAA